MQLCRSLIGSNVRERRDDSPTLLARADELIDWAFWQLLMAAHGTNRPFAALHKFGCYRKPDVADGSSRQQVLTRTGLGQTIHHRSGFLLVGLRRESTISRAAACKSARWRAAKSSTVNAVLI